MLNVALFLFLATDLSTYRQFQFGMELPAAVQAAHLTLADVKSVSVRPAVIQTFEWRPRRQAAPDSVETVDLSFYDGHLFRVVVNYQRLRTEGMTTSDLVDSLSGTYGAASTPEAQIMLPSYNNEKVPVLARWEDAQYSYSLVHTYLASFALIGESKVLAGRKPK